jgi:hypothetical protein
MPPKIVKARPDKWLDLIKSLPAKYYTPLKGSQASIIILEDKTYYVSLTVNESEDFYNLIDNIEFKSELLKLSIPWIFTVEKIRYKRFHGIFFEKLNLFLFYRRKDKSNVCFSFCYS